MTNVNVLIAALFFLTSCSNQSNPSLLTGIDETPIITGIYVTTEYDPSGTGEIYGSPHPTDSHFRVVPNPYYGRSTYQSNLSPVVKITNLPGNARIEILKAVIDKPQEQNATLGGATTFHLAASPIRTILKSSIDDTYTSVQDWDLKDDQGQDVASGFYRIYIIYGENKIDWIDAYIIRAEDISTWVDPTGWLPEGWNRIIVVDI